MLKILEQFHNPPSPVQGAVVDGMKIAVTASAALHATHGMGYSPGMMVLSILGGLAVGRVLSSGVAAQSVNHVFRQLPPDADCPVTDRPELIELVDHCAGERGIRQPINLYYSNQTGLLATAWTPVHGHCLFINPDTIGLLTKDEMRFAVDHELTHINRHDNTPRFDHAAMTMIVGAGIFSSAIGALTGASGLGGLGMSLVHAEALHLFDRMGSRIRERRSDKVAAEATQDAQGGISLLERMPVFKKKYAESRNIDPTKDFEPKHPVNKLIMRIFAEHPSDQHRIASLKKWQEKKSLLTTSKAMDDRSRMP